MDATAKQFHPVFALAEERAKYGEE